MFPSRNNLVLRLEGQPGPQREKKRAFNMGTGLLTSAHSEERTEKEREKERVKGGQQLNRGKRETINTEENLYTFTDIACLFKGLLNTLFHPFLVIFSRAIFF